MSVSVIVVGFGDEPVLESSLWSILGQVGAQDEVLLVDHGITKLPPVEGVTLVTPAANTGFGGGCAAGVGASSGEVLVFVNSDAEVRPGAIAALVERVKDHAVGLAGGLILLPGEVEVVNSVGLPVHLSGLSWCDGYGEQLGPRHVESRRLASVSGALFACRREVWDALGGMDTSYFMYHEDTDLSLRCHLAGLDVVYCPEATAVHAYEFSRNSDKMFYLERNRFLTVFGNYPSHLLARVLPAILVLEPLYLAIAIRDGWGRKKLRAWWWLLRHADEVSARRRRVQSSVRAPRALDRILTPAITQAQLQQPAAMAALNSILRLYWRVARPRSRTGSNVRRSGRRQDIAVLRTNPNDSSLARLLTILVEQYRTTAIVWDRKQDFSCSVNSPRLTIRRSKCHGEYYRLTTIITVALLQPWFLWSALRVRPRVVHAMDLDTAIVGLAAARLMRVPFVYQCLDPYAASLPQGWPAAIARLVQRVENAVISRADLFVITDQGRMPQHDGADPRMVVELPNIPMHALEAEPCSDGDLIVGYIGSLVPHRALDLLVDTTGSLAGDGVRLILGGYGVLEDDLRRQSERYPNVEFLGPVPYQETLRILGRADVLVQLGDPTHPALRWVSPNKVFESMALGRPVLVAAGTLAADRATEAGHGVTVKYGDRDDLRNALLRLRDDPAGRALLGARGREAAATRWSRTAVSEEVVDAYRQLIDRGTVR